MQGKLTYLVRREENFQMLPMALMPKETGYKDLTYPLLSLSFAKLFKALLQNNLLCEIMHKFLKVSPAICNPIVPFHISLCPNILPLVHGNDRLIQPSHPPD